MASRSSKQALWSLALLSLASSVTALPQAQGTSSSSSSSRTRTGSSSSSSSSARGSFVGTMSSISPTSSLDLPDADPSGYPNNTDVPVTPLPPQIPDLPEYAITYAPVVYLHTNESYWPSSLNVHLNWTYPWMDYRPIDNTPNPLTLENMDFVNNAFYYLSVNDPAVEPRPSWYYSDYGKPDASGFSGGNVTIIAVNKTESVQPGVVDVFYFLFYSFNEGSNVGGQSYGNHISDIEHIMIRFMDEQPAYMFLSQHEDGFAYTWDALQKDGNRPIAYSAIGGHANYPVAGTFDLVSGLVGLIDDQTAAGPRWDVVQNYNGYWWSGNDGFVNANGSRATTWDRVPNNGYLKQQGKWGNQALQSDNPDQQIIFGQQAWSDGATGPVDPSKGLARTWLCIKYDCIANTTLPASDAVQATQQLSTQGGLAIRTADFSVGLTIVILAVVSAVLI